MAVVEEVLFESHHEYKYDKNTLLKCIVMVINLNLH